MPGRSCPLAYRYTPSAIALATPTEVETLYVIGGLYGNVFALARVLEMAALEKQPVTLCFNGDFNWFNIAPEDFQQINQAVLKHHAIQGNVEYELHQSDNSAGCGCAYPDEVDQETVERSNQIHAQLYQTAARFPSLLEQIKQLPLFRRYQIGSQHLAVVHGDAHSLAGWRFDAHQLRQSENDLNLRQTFEEAQVDVFASSHTCLPILKQLGAYTASKRAIINNGAAGMPNFAETQFGVLSRISVHAGVHQVLYGTTQADLIIEALPIEFDYLAWQAHFSNHWQRDSAAYLSYFQRICRGPNWALRDAIALI